VCKPRWGAKDPGNLNFTPKRVSGQYRQVMSLLFTVLLSCDFVSLMVELSQAEFCTQRFSFAQLLVVGDWAPLSGIETRPPLQVRSFVIKDLAVVFPRSLINKDLVVSYL
jgi:hypothetical protein